MFIFDRKIFLFVVLTNSALACVARYCANVVWRSLIAFAKQPDLFPSLADSDFVHYPTSARTAAGCYKESTFFVNS